MNLVMLEATNAQGSPWMSIVMIVLLCVIFYFFMIRPQSKKQKELKKFQESLTNGKKVITAGGIYGTVKEVKEDYILIEIDNNVRIRVAKNMVYDSPENAAQNAEVK